MRHTGKSPAIYATKRKAYLVYSGQPIPRGAVFVISHGNSQVLAITYDKSTIGVANGVRKPELDGHPCYSYHAEAVLYRVVNAYVEPMSFGEFQVLRNALGAPRLSPLCPDLGWRNYYMVPKSVDDGDSPINSLVDSLVDRGLMVAVAEGHYMVTARGAAIAGVHPDDVDTVAIRALSVGPQSNAGFLTVVEESR